MDFSALLAKHDAVTSSSPAQESGKPENSFLSSPSNFSGLAPPEGLFRQLSSSRDEAEPRRPRRSTPIRRGPKYRRGRFEEISAGVYEIDNVMGKYELWNPQWRSSEPGNVVVTFEAKADHDVALCLASREGTVLEGKVYEIVLGGWKNTKSVIRTEAQGQDRAVSTAPRICAASEFRRYWVVAAPDGLVCAGLGELPGANIVVAFRDPQSSEDSLEKPSHLSFTTWDTLVTIQSVRVGTLQEFGLQPPTDVDLEEYSASHVVALEEARSRNLDRAKRFDVDFVRPDEELAFAGLSQADRERFAKKRTEFTAGFATGFDPESAEEKAKREARAARFGIVATPVDTSEAEALAQRKARAARFGVALMDHVRVEQVANGRVPRKDPPRDVSGVLQAQIRPDALHLYGFQHMFTNHVLEAFQGFGPSHVEWLNDASCNVVFEDGHTAKRALAGLTKELTADAAEGGSPLASELHAMGWRVATLKGAQGDEITLMRPAYQTDVKDQVGSSTRTVTRHSAGPSSGRKRRRPEGAAADREEEAELEVVTEVVAATTPVTSTPPVGLPASKRTRVDWADEEM